MNKSKFAFQCNLNKIFGDNPYAYMWCFTFADIPEIEDAAQRWRHLVNWLVRHFDGQVYGVRVYELHKTHGLHIHALFNQWISVNLLRPVARHFGFGRIHVKRVDREGANYLAKYLTKQDRDEWLQHKRLWTCFGRFTHTKVKDIIVESDFTRAVKFCQQELGMSKLPFLFVNVLQQFATDDPAKLKLACTMLKKSGPYYKDIIRVLNAYTSRPGEPREETLPRDAQGGGAKTPYRPVGINRPASID